MTMPDKHDCGICNHEGREPHAFETTLYIAHLLEHLQEFIQWDGAKYVPKTSRFNLGDVLTPVGGSGTLTVKKITVETWANGRQEWYEFEEVGIVMEGERLELLVDA